ncbi:transcriptional regulator FnrL [Paracoccus aminophilus]|uniref:Transcriptional activator protein FnrL n=1 Tax=Paracoccus aminophilus JCM 7686 TaxID=1367847 RepID=S5XXP2_PARAH|nr:Crp/Fnr family transcriptional regulator [Paracoccus aminophilus]AGT08215.1 transcriptional activator protein FnrL [Paracoccus aminophilus JCM 7686]
MPEDVALIAPQAACVKCPIRYRAVCAHCEKDELDILEDAKVYRTYSAGQVVAWSGDRMDFVASVVSGVATLTQTMEDGRTQMVGLLLPSDFLGRPGRERVSYTVTATTDLLLCCFRRKPFEQLLARTPRLTQRLLEMTLDELDAAREWLLLLGRKSAREKIASLLAILCRREAALNKDVATGRMTVLLPLTREAMADYLGLTLETVSRQITALKKDGIIDMVGKRQINVPSYQDLVAESGDDADGGPLI